METRRLSWGIIGAGSIARTFAAGLLKSRTGRLVAVGSRDFHTARSFVDSCDDVRPVAGYKDLIEDPGVDAVYIATPHPMHARWAIHAARCGKHILCEKPLTVTAPEAFRVADEAKKAGVFLMEAFMYRCHPQTQKLVELVADRAIGEVLGIEADFGFHSPFSPSSRLYSNALAGGGILDVGCYTVSMSRLLAGAATGQAFADPLKVTGAARLNDETGVDEYAAATLLFPGGILARVACAIRLKLSNRVKVRGTCGSLEVSDPWIPAREGGVTNLLLRRDGANEEIVSVSTDQHLYALEIDAVGDAVAGGKLESPFMPVADSLGNMQALDAWREAAGVIYDAAHSEEEAPI
jgi:predicted dehydrogenase